MFCEHLLGAMFYCKYLAVCIPFPSPRAFWSSCHWACFAEEEPKREVEMEHLVLLAVSSPRCWFSLSSWTLQAQVQCCWGVWKSIASLRRCLLGRSFGFRGVWEVIQVFSCCLLSCVWHCRTGRDLNNCVSWWSLHPVLGPSEPVWGLARMVEGNLGSTSISTKALWPSLFCLQDCLGRFYWKKAY